MICEYLELYLWRGDLRLRYDFRGENQLLRRYQHGLIPIDFIIIHSNGSLGPAATAHCSILVGCDVLFARGGRYLPLSVVVRLPAVVCDSYGLELLHKI